MKSSRKLQVAKLRAHTS